VNCYTNSSLLSLGHRKSSSNVFEYLEDELTDYDDELEEEAAVIEKSEYLGKELQSTRDPSPMLSSKGSPGLSPKRLPEQLPRRSPALSPRQLPAPSPFLIPGRPADRSPILSASRGPGRKSGWSPMYAPLKKLQKNAGDQSATSVRKPSVKVFKHRELGPTTFKKTFPNFTGKLIVMLFFEDDCMDCLAVRQLFQEFVLMYPDVVFLETNARVNMSALKELKIIFLPTFLAFR
jgi:thiol-disulfide isomerase/thioredoxin